LRYSIGARAVDVDRGGDLATGGHAWLGRWIVKTQKVKRAGVPASKPTFPKSGGGSACTSVKEKGKTLAWTGGQQTQTFRGERTDVSK